MQHVDVLADLLDGARARGGVFARTALEPPWSLRIDERAPLAIASCVTGSGWLLDDGPPVRLDTRDMVVIRGTAPYTVADDPATEPQLLVLPGGRCEVLPGAAKDHSPRIGVRTHGRDTPESTLIVSGTYQLAGDLSRRLLVALPRVLVVPAADIPSAVLDLVVGEISRDRPGQQVLLDRWLDLALITTLRAWFDRPEADAPGWYRAQDDPVVGTALRLMHDDPAHPWTLAQLASRCGISRSGLARRFAALVGEPPMAYLTGWRMALAADLLRSSRATVEAVARRVGYANAFALSVAFTRVKGLSPRAYRQGRQLTSAS